MEEGLDMAIVNAQKIVPLYKINEKGRELCRRLVFDERVWDGDRCTSDPLMELMAYYADKKHSVKTEKKERTGTIEEILKTGSSTATSRISPSICRRRSRRIQRSKSSTRFCSTA